MDALLQASLKALQVLLEKSAPSASPLLRRLPKDQPGYVQVSTLLTFLTNPTNSGFPAGAASSMHSSFLDTNDFRALDPRSSRATAAAAAPHLPPRCNLSGALAGSMLHSDISGDLRTSEVLFALDTGSEIVPGLSSFHLSERTNEMTMTDSAALSGAAGSMPVSAYRDRMSASQIPEGHGDVSAPSSMIGPSSATSAPPGSIPGSRSSQAPPAGVSAPTVTLDSSRRPRPPTVSTSDPRIPPLPLHGLGRINIPQPGAGLGASGAGKRGRVVGSSGFSRSVRSSPRSDVISYSSMPHSDGRYGSWRASDSVSGGWRAAVIYDAVSTPGVTSTGHHEFTPRSIYVTAQSPASGIVDGVLTSSRDVLHGPRRASTGHPCSSACLRTGRLERPAPCCRPGALYGL